MAEAAKQKGTVKWFNSTKGFGFITPDVPEGSEEAPEDLFVHQVPAPTRSPHTQLQVAPINGMKILPKMYINGD